MLSFTCPEHVFAHFGQQISRKRHASWRMTQNVSMRHKFLPWEGILYCTDGIEAALIDQHINTLYIVVIDNLDDVNKEALKLSLESTSQSEENKAPKKPKISVSKLNQLLAHYEL